MMNRLESGFRCFCLVIMLLFCSCILWQCGFTMTYADNLRNIIQPGRLPFFLFGMAAAAAVLFCFLFRILDRLSEKQQRWIGAGAFGIILLGQLLMILNFRTALRGDQMKVLEAAIDLMSSKTIADSFYNEYFSRCSNNIPITMVTYLFVNIFKLLHLPKSLWMDLARVLGTAFLDGGLFFGYLILREIRGQKYASMMMVLCVFQPMLYLLTGVYYSSTISLFFGMGAIWLYIKNRGKGRKWLLSCFLLGVFLGFGFKIRATAFICGIAIGICGLFSLRSKEDVKLAAKKLIVSLAGFLLVMGLFKTLHQIYVQADYQDTEYTLLHYVMMGANGNGTYSPADAAYTQSFEGKEAKNRANKKLLMERLEHMGPVGILELMGRKLAITFSDGTDDFYDAFNGSLKDAGNLTGLNGTRRDFFVGYCHLYNTLMWTGIVVFLVTALGKKDHKDFVITLAALGGIFFQVIWECGEAYSVPYLILFLMLFAEGFEGMGVLADRFCERRIVKSSALGMSLLLLVGGTAWIFRGFSGVVLVNDEYRVRQTTYELEIHKAGQVVEQTFTASKPFNEIELFVYNIYKEHNQSVYQVTLLTENGQTIHEEYITAYMLPEYGSAYVQFDTVIPNGETQYRIRIQSARADEKSGIVFPYHSTGICDLYQGGSLWIDGKQKKNCDLAFTVYLRSQSEGI